MKTFSEKVTYDCVVVGSGAGGGWAAHDLTAYGFRVLMLEAGTTIDPAKDFMSHKWPFESRYRGGLSAAEQRNYGAHV